MNFTKIIPFVILLFIINPMLTIVGLAAFGLSIGNKPATDKNIIFLILFGLLCCVEVSLINTTKVPEGDLWDYVYKYQLASRLNYFTYLLEGPDDVIDTIKEPAFYTLVWVLNRLLDGNVKLYLFTMSMLEFTLFAYALVYFGKAYGIRVYAVMTGIIVMCFLPYIFIHSLNIIRQFLANALLLFIMIRRFFYDKREWATMAVMVLIHTTSAIFLPLLLLPAFGKPFKKSWIWFVGTLILLVSFQVVALYFLSSGSFYEDDAVGYALSRAGQGNMGEYQTTIVTLISSLIFLFYSIYVYSGKTIMVDNGLRRFFSTIIILSVFIFLMQDQGQITSRFAHYSFTFLPFLLTIFFHSKMVDKYIQFTICIMTMLFFSYFLYDNVFTFEVDMAGWVTPALLYFTSVS